MNRMTIIQALKTKKAIVGLASSMSLVAGAAIGAAIATQKLKTAFDAKLEQEIEQTKDYYQKYYSKLSKQEEWATPESAAIALGTEPVVTVPIEDPSIDDAIAALRLYQSETTPRVNYGGHKNLPSDDKPLVEITTNVFTNAAHITRDLEETELEQRDPDRPYVISAQEYYHEIGHEQINLTYYDKDKVVANDSDEVVSDPEVDVLIGLSHLEMFGVGSGDPNVVFIRNNNSSMDFEITWSEGSYKALTGFVDDEDLEANAYLKHSDDRPRTRKFRHKDD